METQQKKVSKKACAKVNLVLDITGRRENGYHDLDMVMQQVDLGDGVSLSFLTKEEENILRGQGVPSEDAGLPVFLCVKSENPNPELSVPEKNIACKAVKSCIEAGGRLPGQALLLEIEKKIPVAAGLAGGSTDAAAALVLTNELMGFNFDNNKLMEIGVGLGADVPYCILGGTARARGIGEILTPLTPLRGCTILLVKPEIGVSTAWAYGEYDKIKKSPLRYDAGDMVKALESRNIKNIAERLGNVLEGVTIARYPEIDGIKNKMKKKGALSALMSGSGPTVFGIFEDREAALAALDEFKKEGYGEAFVTLPI